MPCTSAGVIKRSAAAQVEDEPPMLNDENTADTDGNFNSTTTKAASTFKAPAYQQQKKKT
ncbi:unnamed protein product [Timema podura]|uniref:Uncharacterized protein n=1 Tax=Timema podura TaxID=61482 RepID=A0ABN7NNY6_TIMPD|nr:unnamed protein product [Timema podura]